MERRKFIAGVGSLAAGGAAALGTGAFTSVSASRDIDVEVASDSTAYLRLEGAGGNNSDYVTNDGTSGTLSISLDEGNSSNISGGGEGVNPDAVTKIDNLFEVENQGTQEVEVTIKKDGANSEYVDFYPSTSYSDAIGSSSGDGVMLTAGTSETISLKIDTEESGLGDGAELLDAVTFNADA